jgi:hypothetical protein
MRTTLTIEPDIAAQLGRIRKEREVSLKALVNDALRRGLRQLSAPEKKSRKRSFTQPVDLGQPLIGNIDCIGELLARLEGELYR